MDIRVSIGSTQALGLRDVRVDAEATTAHLMVGERCVNGCTFCAQGRNSHTPRGQLSRVTWPVYPIDEVVSRLASAHCDGRIQRACVQVIHGGQYREQISEFFAVLHRSAEPVPVSVNMDIRSRSDADRLFSAGAERLGVALDAASPQVFARCKGRSPADWLARIEMLQDLAVVYSGRISTHLIVGLGETERDLVDVIQIMTDVGVTVGLFAFTPVPGTPLEDRRQPCMASYRRVQLAAHLIAQRAARREDIVFDERGKIAHIAAGVLKPEVLRWGMPFQTSGCAGCNRPYYNERPGRVPYNYPRPPRPWEVRRALMETGMFPAAADLEVAET